MRIQEIGAKRLRLRQWQDPDYPVFASINADVKSMRFFPATLSVKQINELARYCRSLIEQQGLGAGLWRKRRRPNSSALPDCTSLRINCRLLHVLKLLGALTEHHGEMVLQQRRPAQHSPLHLIS